LCYSGCSELLSSKTLCWRST